MFFIAQNLRREPSNDFNFPKEIICPPSTDREKVHCHINGSVERTPLVLFFTKGRTISVVIAAQQNNFKKIT